MNDPFERDHRSALRRCVLVGCMLLILGQVMPSHAQDRLIHVLTATNQIATVPVGQPGQATDATAVTGVNPNEQLVAIDVRPQNGRLYGLGFNTVAGTLQLYLVAVDSAGARAFPIGTSGAFVDAGGSAVAVAGPSFGMDFNPAVDRLRINTSAGQNFRMNPNTGAFIDGDLGGAAGSVAGLNMDGAISGGTTAVDAAAYTNNTINTAVTTLYNLDSSSNSLFIQNPPNAGTQTLPLVLTLGGNPLDFGADCGFDIPVDVNATASNAAANGSALAALSVAGVSSLYRIGLSTGVAESLGAFGVVVRDIAVVSQTSTAATLSATGTQIGRVLTQNPAQGATVNITGVLAGERIVGIDGRPATGQVMGLGINPVADTGTLYLIDSQTGVALAIGTPASIAYVGVGGTPIDLPDGSWGFDFNPQVDRVRVVSASGLNFRINPITGAPVDGDLGGAAGSVAGINPDAGINGIAGVGISGVAYANNIAGTPFTTQYTLDPQGNRLSIQNPPNSGTQTLPRTVTLDGAVLDFDTAAGFDIPIGVNAPSAGADAVGDGYAVMTVAGNSALYRIDLPSGAAAAIGTVGTGGAPIEGLIVWNRLADAVFSDGFE